MKLLPVLFISLLIALTNACTRESSSRSAATALPVYEVELTPETPDRIIVRAVLPAAPTGLHMSALGANSLPDGWATFVADLSVTDEFGELVPVQRSGPRTWNLTARPAGPVRLEYEVHLEHDTTEWSGGIDGAAMQLPWGAFFSGRATFVTADDGSGPVLVRLLTSPGWAVAAPWPAVEGEPDTFRAPTEETLTESFAFIGDFEGFAVDRNGFEIVFALGGETVRARAEEFRSTAEANFDYFIEMVGGPPRPAPGEPSERILVVINEADQTDGEVIGNHINMLLSRSPEPLGRFFSRFGFSHELFHLWNGKSFRRHGPEDWFAEGVTNYYALKALRQAGNLTEDEFYHFLDAMFYGRYVSDEGFGSLSLRDAATEKHGHWGMVYGGGMFAGICLDAEIRRASGDTRSLDDVVRDLYERFGGSADTYDIEDLEASVRRQSDYDPTDFIARHVRGAEPIPVADCLALFGLDARAEDGHLTVSRRAGSTAAETGRIEGLLGRIAD